MTEISTSQFFVFVFLESFFGVFWVLVSFSMFLVLVFWVWGVFRFFKFFGGFALGFLILVFGFFLVLVFVILIVVAYCTQLLSQAMYNLMMAAMAETCSCQLPSTIQLHNNNNNNNIVVFYFLPTLYTMLCCASYVVGF